RRTGARTAQASPQTLALPRARLADLLGQRPNEFERTRHHVLWDILLIGEIDTGLDQRQRLDQPLPPRLGAVAEQTLEVLVGLSALSLGFGRDQVGEPFDRGQIHAAVFERATREFSAFRMAQTGGLGPGPPAPPRSPRGRRALAARPCLRRFRCSARETTTPVLRR